MLLSYPKGSTQLSKSSLPTKNEAPEQEKSTKDRGMSVQAVLEDCLETNNNLSRKKNENEEQPDVCGQPTVKMLGNGPSCSDVETAQWSLLKS